MTAAGSSPLHAPEHPVRFVTAAALFDGHDAAINIMRRILQSQGAEVDPPGPRPVGPRGGRRGARGGRAGRGDQLLPGRPRRVLRATWSSSWPRPGPGDVKVFGGGGGVIVPEEIERLPDAGVRIFSPEDGQRLGLPRMINELIRDCDVDLAADPAPVEAVLAGERRGAGPGDHLPAGRPPPRRRPHGAGRGRGRPARCPCSASPAPAARASRR